MNFRYKRVATALVLALGGLTSCNAVLGIDEAKLSGGTAGTGASGGVTSVTRPYRVPPLETCDGPSADCEPCLNANCSQHLQAALQSADGRVPLDRYRACLGAQCDDTMEAGCLEELPNELFDLQICVQTECQECVGSPLIRTVDLYCACMAENCPDNVTDELGGDCPTTVTTQLGDGTITLTDLGCRLAHCEFAIADFKGHCDHAVGVGFCPLENPANTCTERAMSGWTCNVDADCCSDDCPATNICN